MVNYFIFVKDIQWITGRIYSLWNDLNFNFSFEEIIGVSSIII